MKYLKGSFLIATPSLVDPNFARSVVYMTEHNEEGAFGLVVTRPSEGINLLDICEKIYEDRSDFPDDQTLKSIGVFTGGPVQPSAVFFVHTHPGTTSSLGPEPIVPGTFLGNQADELREVLDRLEDEDPPKLKAFFGYSGWGAGQLEKELQAGGWLVKPAELDQIFSSTPEGLWGELVRSFGGAVGILGYMPKDPGLN